MACDAACLQRIGCSRRDQFAHDPFDGTGACRRRISGVDTLHQRRGGAAWTDVRHRRLGHATPRRGVTAPAVCVRSAWHRSGEVTATAGAAATTIATTPVIEWTCDGAA
jgi:hypothetical protein